ncbi:MAG: NADH-quinone oxidoreductase subunit M [Gemmataceae bacterium]
MDLDALHVMPVMRLALLAVLFAPLAAAAVCGVLGGPFVRRFALLFALAHLGLTAGLTAAAYLQLADRADARTFGYYQPIAVPGDRGAGGADPNVSEHETGWDLLTLGPSAGPRVAAPAIQFFVGLDGFNVWLVALTSLITLVAVLASWESVGERRGAYFAWLFVLETGVIGAFVAFDVILFYVFFELTLIPAFFLIGSWGVGAARREAARRFFLYTLFGSLLTLTGVIGVVLTHPTPLSPQAAAAATPADRTPMFVAPLGPDGVPTPDRGPITFAVPRLMQNVEAWSSYYTARVLAAEVGRFTAEKAAAAAEQKAAAAPADVGLAQAATAARVKATAAAGDAATAKGENDRYRAVQAWLFIALMAGFAVKIPIVPFHTWLPAAYGEAPLGVTVVLSALLSKLGTFGVLRLVLPLAPDAAVAYGLPVFGTLGAAGIVYAALCAFAQRDIKQLVAYSSVSHLGFLAIGLFTLRPEGLSGAALHMVNHGLSTGAMFALLAFLADRYRTLDSNQYGGLWGRFPGYTFLFMVVCLASIGLPGLNNFVSEMLMLAGAVDPLHAGWAGYWPATAAVFGILLSAWYTLTLVRRVFFGPLREPPTAVAPPTGLTGREWVGFGLPAALCLVLGLMPQPVLTSMAWDARVMALSAANARFRADLSEPTPDQVARIVAAREAQRAVAPARGIMDRPQQGGKGRKAPQN